MELKLPYIVVTNGMVNYACKVDHIRNTFEYLMVIPLYEEIRIELAQTFKNFPALIQASGHMKASFPFSAFQGQQDLSFD